MTRGRSSSCPPEPVSEDVVAVEVFHRGTSYVLAARKADYLTRTMQATKRFYEPELLEAIANERRAGIYMDVGACFGNHAVFFAHECESSGVLAFEPNGKSFAILAQNAMRHDFTAVPGAIHDEWLSVEICDHHDTNRGRSFCRQGGTVPCYRLDSFTDPATIACIKIDVEGAELPVLRSAQAILERSRPLLATEANTKTRLHAIAELLAPHRYDLVDCFGPTPTYLWRPR